ncbi:hypothetical protein PQR66_25330 [Paraburkholderia agricolaris]|uniref:Uncharacterized protein n=1 Tax=Paraburkholderia agricolaris TaxID=2152888 RepID=A0ABW8ZT38_9BURK
MLWRSRHIRSCFSRQTPGALVPPAVAESFAKKIEHCKVVDLGARLHYLQEDHPEVIGATVNEWLLEPGVGALPEQRLTL